MLVGVWYTYKPAAAHVAKAAAVQATVATAGAVYTIAPSQMPTIAMPAL